MLIKHFTFESQRRGRADEQAGSTNSPSGQVGTVLGDRWAALSESQREPYNKKAAADLCIATCSASPFHPHHLVVSSD